MVTTRSGHTYEAAHSSTSTTPKSVARKTHVLDVEPTVSNVTTSITATPFTIFANVFSTSLEVKKFNDLHDFSDGLVFLGCGGDPIEWVYGISEMLLKDKIVSPGTFDIPFLLRTTGGRIDLVFPFAPNKNASEMLAMWRLKCGDASWISDYVVNYKKQYM